MVDNLLNHSEFIEKYAANEIAVDISKNKAGFLYEQAGLMPVEFRSKQALMRAIAFGCTLVGILLFFFVHWGWATGTLLFGLYMFPQAQASGVKGVMQAALQSPRVYQVAIDNKVIRVRNRS